LPATISASWGRPTRAWIAYRHGSVTNLHARAAYARLDRLADWQGYVAMLRQANRRKRRLVEVLDLLVSERSQFS
jgi:hypothetical protein